MQLCQLLAFISLYFIIPIYRFIFSIPIKSIHPLHVIDHIHMHHHTSTKKMEFSSEANQRIARISAHLYPPNLRVFTRIILF